MRFINLSALVFGSVVTMAATPAISGVVNAASWLPPALPNSGVAQGAIFTVVGSDLGPSTFLQVKSFPLPTTEGLGGTTIKVKVGGVTETCIMIYTVASQVAAILPSATPTGTGTLTVTYQGESGSLAIQVVASNVGTFALNQDGTGPGVFTDAVTYKPITMINAAHPGETLTLWATGLGAITGDETEAPKPVDLHTGVQVLIENQPAKVLYGGRSSYAGLDQINFVVPDGVSGCKTSVVVIVKGITGNVTSMAIAPNGQTTCNDTHGSLTAAILQKAIANGSLNGATVQLSHVDGNDKLAAEFATYPLNSLIRSFAGTNGPSIGSCLAYETYATSLDVIDPIQPTFLDAGSQLTITGPAGAQNINAISTGFYPATLATAPPYFITPGNFTVTNGAGGSNVGPFTWNLTLPPSVVPTNIPTSIHRSQDLNLTWSGGAGFSAVTIFGYSGVPVTSTLLSFVEFICNADPSAQQFTVPSAILSLLPPNGFGAKGELGVSIQIAGIPLATFNVPGSPGIDIGVFSAFIANGSVAKIQE